MRCLSYSAFIARWPSLMILSVFAVILVTTLVGFLTTSLPDFSDPTKGFEPRGTTISKREFTTENLEEALNRQLLFNGYRPQVSSPPDETVIGDQSGGQGSIDNEPASYGRFTSRKRRRDERRSVVDVSGANFQTDDIIGFEGDDLLSLDSITAACELSQNVIHSFPGYSETSPDVSIGNVLASMVGVDSCPLLTKAHVGELRRRIAVCASLFINGNITAQCSDIPCSRSQIECTESTYMFTLFNYVIDMDFTEAVASHCKELRSDCQGGNFDWMPGLRYSITFLQSNMGNSFFLDLYHSRLESPITQGPVTLVAIDFDIEFDVFQSRLLSDAIYPGLSVVIIFLITWIYTRSLFITTLSMVAIVSSLGIAYFLYKIIFQVEFFAFLNVIAVVIALGVGSDDVFVYVDVWRQTMRRHPTATMEQLVAMTLRHAALSMFVTSFTTAAAFVSNIVSPITSVKCFGLYAGTAIVVNYVLMITWLPAVVVLYEKYVVRLWAFISKRIGFSSCDGDNFRKIKGWISYPFREGIPTLVTKMNWLLLVVLAALAVGMSVAVFVHPKLKLPTNHDWQLFKTSDILSRYTFEMKPHFAFNGPGPPNPAAGMRLSIVFGVEAEDPGNHMNPNNYPFHLSYSRPSLSSMSPEGQLWLMKFCNETKKQPFVYRYPTYGDCFIYSFADFLTLLNNTAICDLYVANLKNYNLPPDRRCCSVTLPTDPDTFAYCVKHWSAALQSEFSNSFTPSSDQVYFDEDGNMRVIDASVYSTLPRSAAYVDMNKEWNQVENWLQSLIDSAPPEFRDGWFNSAWHFSLYDLQKSLNFGTLVSMSLSVGLSFAVLLLTTFNILISFYAVVAIAGTLLSTVGTLVLLGWQLNILESVAISVAVGLSVDFTVHYGVAYRICPDERRRQRTVFSVTHMGPAITMAALTTFVAGAMMMPSSIVAYIQLGTFLMMIMFYSWLYANFFFQPLCSLLGPQGTFGQLKLPKALAFLDCYGAAGRDDAAGEDGPGKKERSPTVSKEEGIPMLDEEDPSIVIEELHVEILRNL